MSKTNYAGIDYGLGKSNVDTQTGIRYGVIACNACNGNAVEDIYSNGTDLDFEEYIDQAKKAFFGAMEDYIGDESHLADLFNDHLRDAIGEGYENTGDCTRYLYESDGLKLQVASDGDLWVLKSPYFTRAQFCSPCAPGAGYLANPCDDGPKTYCLGHDWFDYSVAPYPIYSVETGEEIKPTDEALANKAQAESIRGRAPT